MHIVPACFPSLLDFERWAKSFGAKDCGFCHDCLPSYQLRMKKLRRCEHPEIMFSIGEDGVVGLTEIAA